MRTERVMVRIEKETDHLALRVSINVVHIQVTCGMGNFQRQFSSFLGLKTTQKKSSL